MNDLATAKLHILQHSFLCLWFGLLGLLPFIGLPFGLVALLLAGRIRRQEKRFWNAAKPYRICGAACAGVGTVFWGGVLLFLVRRALLFSTLGSN